MELYKQMTAEAVSTARCKNVPEGQPLSGEKSQDTRASGKPSEINFRQVYPARRLKMVKFKGHMLLEVQLLAGISSPF
ncbi:uncharacterized protein Pyn_19036 [Prunus yedoensis var. nudiflora]|uniref:Uncharacterized protein n=1 Tax=Prunus yedoensis var. nudiflora TaxID=2094558 RepID=A0A314UEH9_PRUYE|nr:uncharacterized protein Pyn_19036 [Prunus yedoensis var. nudiflora]